MSRISLAIEGIKLSLEGSESDTKVHALQVLHDELVSSLFSFVDVIGNESDRINSILKNALREPNYRVATAGIACCTQLFVRLAEAVALAQSRDGSILVASSIEALLLTSPIITLLGDAKDATRLAARHLLVQASTAALYSDAVSGAGTASTYLEVEKYVRDHALLSKNARTREQGVIYLAALKHSYPSLPIKSWTPCVVTLLTDADSLVRDAARESAVSIYGDASTVSAARSDFKREMLKQGVRKAIADPILQALAGTSQRTSGFSLSDAVANGQTPTRGSFGSIRARSSIPTSGVPSTSGDSNVVPSSSIRAAASITKPSERLLRQPKDLTQAEILAQIEAEAIAAVEAHTVVIPRPKPLNATYIVSEQDLRDDFAHLRQCFDGKETEHNWQDRERAIFRMRGVLLGGGHRLYQQAFLRELRQTTDCLFKAINSLRTTLAATACALAAELAKALNADLAPLVDHYLAGLFKLATVTKRSIAQASQDAADIWIQQCGYSPKTLLLISDLLGQKNNQARLYATQHMLAFVRHVVAPHQGAIASTGGQTLLQQLLHRALTDASAPVREAARKILTELYTTWPRLAALAYESLDIASRKLADKARQSVDALTIAKEDQFEVVSPQARPRQSIKEIVAAQQSAIMTSTSSSLWSPTEGTPKDHTLTLGQASPRDRKSILLSTSDVRKRSPRNSVVSSRSPPYRPAAQGRRTSSITSSASSHTPNDAAMRRQTESPGIRRQTGSPNLSHSLSATQVAAIHALPPSPTLSAIGVDFSDAEDYSVNIANTALVPHEVSSEDDSMLFPIRSPLLSSRTGCRSACRQRLSDDSSSDDDVQRRAKMAEEIAEDFANVTTRGDETGNDTVVHEGQQQQRPMNSPHRTNPMEPNADVNNGAVSTAANDGVTPLLQRMRRIHLKDSPAVATNGSLLATQPTSLSWWAVKADLQVSRAQPAPARGDTRQDWVENALRRMNDASITLPDILSLSRLAMEVWEANSADYSGKPSIWPRMCESALRLLKTNDDSARIEGCLVLLRSLLSHQTAYLQDETAAIIDVGLRLHQRIASLPAEAVIAILQCVAEQSDQIYALSCIRSGLETLSMSLNIGVITPVQAEVLAGGLSTVGSLFADLPAELVEDELPRAQQLLMSCMNSSMPKVRRSAALVIVQANKSLGDPNRTFELLQILSENQKNFCTYLFRHEGR